VNLAFISSGLPQASESIPSPTTHLVYTIAKKLQARSRGLAQAINNVGDAKNVLSIAEGGLQKINDFSFQLKSR
jgi:hypothetical protein